MNPVSSSGREKLRVMVFHQRLKVMLINRKLRNKHNKKELSKKEKSKCGDSVLHLSFVWESYIVILIYFSIYEFFTLRILVINGLLE